MFGGVWAPSVVTGGAFEHSYTVPGGKKEEREREGGREKEEERVPNKHSSFILHRQCIQSVCKSAPFMYVCMCVCTRVMKDCGVTNQYSEQECVSLLVTEFRKPLCK